MIVIKNAKVLQNITNRENILNLIFRSDLQFTALLLNLFPYTTLIVIFIRI